MVDPRNHVSLGSWKRVEKESIPLGWVLTPFQVVACGKQSTQKLKQRTEESCRTFISRLKTFYESIEGKDDKPDTSNTTVMEDTLRHKVRKMQDEVLIKILL